MVAPAVEGIDLFKIAGRSISGWIPSLKTGSTVRQPFCSQLEERLLLWLDYHPQVKSYARGDIGPQFATTYRLPIPKDAPFAIGYTFEGNPHTYLPDVVGTLKSGKMFIAEAGMEDDKRGDRNLAKAEAARRLAHLQRGVFWIGTERTLTKRRHYNLVFLHARRKTFPAFAEIAAALQEVWPWGEMAEVAEVASRLEHTFPVNLVEAAIWKVVGDSAAQGHLLVDLEQFTLDRTLPLALLPPDAPPLLFLIRSLTHSCPNRHKREQPFHAIRTPSFRVRRLMPPHCQSHNESTFTAICGPFRRCWLGQPKPA